MGVNKVDWVIISHGDNDHVGGFGALSKYMNIKKVYTSFDKLIKYNKNAQVCIDGYSWSTDGINFKIMQAKHIIIKSKSKSKSKISRNNKSCVLKITDKFNKSILLTGDIEKPAEESLIAQYGKKLRADVLVAPHHGSKTSSSVNWVRLVHPGLVIFATGFYNKFGFPHQVVVDRYKNIGSKLYDVGSLGSFSLMT